MVEGLINKYAILVINEGFIESECDGWRICKRGPSDRQRSRLRVLFLCFFLDTRCGYMFNHRPFSPTTYVSPSIRRLMIYVILYSTYWKSLNLAKNIYIRYLYRWYTYGWINFILFYYIIIYPSAQLHPAGAHIHPLIHSSNLTSDRTYQYQ